MKMFPLLLIAFGAVSSCTSYESARNTHLAREYLTEDLEEQIVFNLIRARKGQPFAHYDVGNTQSVVTVNATPSVGITRTGVSSAARSITRVFTSGSSSTRSNGVTINVTPVFNDPKLYAAYVTFLNLECKPGKFDKPGKCDNSEKSDAKSAAEPDTSLKRVKPQEAPENLSAAKIAFEDDDAASTTKTKTVTTAKGEQPAGDEKSKSENPAKDDKQTTTKTGSEMEANSQTITETETKDPSGTLKEKVVKTETAWAKPKKSFHLDQILIGDIHSIVCDPDKHKPNPAKYVPGTLRKLD